MKIVFPLANRKVRTPLLLLVLSGIMAGCSTGESASGSASAPTASAKADVRKDEQLEPAKPRLSEFVSGPDVRDPFYPHLKKKEEKVATTVARPAVLGDVRGFLTAGFQGIIGTPERRMAMIHNTILEPRKSAVISGRMAGQNHQVSVRCLDVARDSVTIQVEGQPFPITINHQVNLKP